LINVSIDAAERSSERGDRRGLGLRKSLALEVERVAITADSSPPFCATARQPQRAFGCRLWPSGARQVQSALAALAPMPPPNRDGTNIVSLKLGDR